MFLVYIFLFILLFYKTNIYKIKEYNINPLNLNNSNALKGFAAIVVVIHHLSQRINNSIPLILFRYLGYLSVAIFFFFSGYGLMISYKKKKII